MNENELIERATEAPTPRLRTMLAEARVAIRNSGETIKVEELRIREELLASVANDAKQLGSNESIRDDRYRASYGKSSAWMMARSTLIENQNAAEVIEAVLNGRLDQANERRLDVDSRRTDALFAALERDHPLVGLAS